MQASEAVILAFQESAAQLQGAGAALLSALADTLTDQCVVVLRQVTFCYLPLFLSLAPPCLPGASLTAQCVVALHHGILYFLFFNVFFFLSFLFLSLPPSFPPSCISPCLPACLPAWLP